MKDRNEGENEVADLHRGDAYASGEVAPIFSSWRAAQYAQQIKDDRSRPAAAAGENERYLSDLLELDLAADGRMSANEDGSLGYVTSDSCAASVGNGPRGDDTLHRAIPYTSVPSYIATALQGNSTALPRDSTDKVDVVLVDFIEQGIIAILNSLQEEKVYTREDVSLWNDLTTQDIFRIYAQQEWSK